MTPRAKEHVSIYVGVAYDPVTTTFTITGCGLDARAVERAARERCPDSLYVLALWVSDLEPKVVTHWKLNRWLERCGVPRSEFIEAKKTIFAGVQELFEEPRP